jgi:methionyl-tRNA formyltransferase
MKIAFFGSSHFAVLALEALIKSREDIVSVVTQPDKKKGRHLHVGFTDIKAVALEAGLSVFQPQDINSSKSAAFLKNLNADLFVIVAYGQILSQEVLDIPKVLPVNIHASLLPKYRGAAPINWAIMRGEKVTGVTIMKVTRKMDSGPIIMQEEVVIADGDDAVSLEEKVRELGAKLLLESVAAIKNKKFRLDEQDERKVVLAPKLKKDDGRIDWARTAVEINNLVRGAMPWPGAFTHYKGKLFKVYRSKVTRAQGNSPGEIAGISKEGIAVCTGKDSLLIQELQIEGKRRMSAREFVAGHRISPQDKFC